MAKFNHMLDVVEVISEKADGSDITPVPCSNCKKTCITC
jgi:hypothetical protein